MNNYNKVVVLCSGGLDSITTAELYRRLGYDVELLYVSYGNANFQKETRAVEEYAEKHNLKLHIEFMQLGFYNEVIRKGQDYIPMRNLVLLSMAIALADFIGAKTVALGYIKIEDGQDYADCSQQFVDNINKLGLDSCDVQVVTPLMYLTKDKVISLAESFGINLEDIYTCDHPKQDGEPCGTCLKCTDLKRAKELVLNLN